MPLRLVLQLPTDAQPLARRPAPYCLVACAEVRGSADLSRPPLPVPVARQPAPSCLAACIELSAAPQSNFASLSPSCSAATTTPTVRRPTHGPRPTGVHCAVRMLGPSGAIIAGGPPAGATQCVCHCSVRMLGLPSATPSLLLPHVPMTIHRPWCPRDLSPRARLRPLSIIPRFAPLPAPISPVHTPAAPLRPLRFAHGFTMARVLQPGLPCRRTGHGGPQAGLRSGRACW